MAKEPLCLDTDICVDFLRKKGPGFKLLIKTFVEFAPCITVITAFELCLGHIKMKRKDSIDGFIAQFDVLPFDFPASKTAAKIQAELDEKGSGIGIPDVLIAGICVINKVPLLTLNTKHFSRVKGLNLIQP
ncbi:MAG: type II toxin-antitoxin system VapC family toxin [Nitrospirae bacterium]|nr:type II toxin-antitoxin system VapC family toxin [Nitrospirota bacterium]